MPTVPGTLPRQELRPLPTTPMQAPDTAGAQAVGRALTRASNTVNEIVIDRQQERNTTRVLEAEQRLKAEALEFENSIRERRGTNAWGATDEARKWWDERKRELDAELENPAQREAFARIHGELQVRSLGSVERHELDERRQSTADAAAASIQGSIDAAAADPTPERIDGAVADIRTRTAAIAKLHGHTPERRAVNESLALSELHSRVLDGLADTDADAAEAYYARFKDQLVGPQREAARRTVEVAGLRKRAQAATDELESLPLSEALAEARKRYSGDIEDEVVRRLKERAAERDAIRERGERQLADVAWGAFAAGGRDAIPARVWASLDGRTRLAIEREAEVRATGQGIKTDFAVYAELRALAAEDPAKFRGTDLRQYFDKLGAAERKQFLDLQTKMTNPDEQQDAAILSQQLSNMHELLGITGKKQSEKRGQFDSLAMAMIDAEQRRVGRKLNFAERQAVLDQLILERPTRTWYGGTRNVPTYEVEIPEADRAAIIEALRSRGRPATETEIRRLYLLAEQRGAK